GLGPRAGRCGSRRRSTCERRRGASDSVPPAARRVDVRPPPVYRWLQPYPTARAPATAPGGPMDLTLPTWLQQLGWILLKLLPGGILTVWCLWAVNWRKAWPVLAVGGWVPLVLIGVMAAVVWSRVWPYDVIVLWFLPVPNGLWQFGAVAILIGVALFCGWLQ